MLRSNIHTNIIILKLSVLTFENFFSRLFKVKINTGITIKPENDTALVKDATSFNIAISTGNNT